MQTNQDNTVQQCTNCHKQFPIDRIDLHQAYCCRNIRKCAHCDQMIDIQNMDEHQNQKHAKKSCEYCRVQFTNDQLVSHSPKCQMKPTVCQYCQNQVTFGEIHRHEQMCGARTKNCSICNKLVMLKDYTDHQNRCTKKNQERRQERAQVSQDNYANRRQANQQRGDRHRQNSTNNCKQAEKRSNSNHHQKLVKPVKIKPANMIGPQMIKPVLDPVPISIRMALRGKGEYRMPLKSKN